MPSLVQRDPSSITQLPLLLLLPSGSCLFGQDSGLKGAEAKGDTPHNPSPGRKLHPMFRLSQETIAIVTIGLTILGTILYTTARIEDRIDRIQSEARADREALRAEARADRAEVRADREAFQAEVRRLDDQARADREAFEKHITRLTQEQSRLTGMVEQMCTASR